MSVDAEETTPINSNLENQDEPAEVFEDERDVVQRQGWSALGLSFAASSFMTVSHHTNFIDEVIILIVY